MKIRQLLNLLLILALPFVASAQKGDLVVKDPDHSNYVIKGEMHSGMKGNNPHFWLNNVTSKGITFSKESEYSGKYDNETEKVTFSFKRADTDHPHKFNDPLILWTWDKGAGKWKRDAEKTENKATFEESYIFSVMMVLDCSGSMSENGSTNFSVMQQSALAFLDTLQRDYRVRKNIHVGLIGFNTTKYADGHSYSPMPLTDENYQKLRSYINGLRSVENAGTAFYYSVDKGVDLLREDYNNLTTNEKNQFIGATLVAFTDGKDNLSKDFAKKITSLEEYLRYMQDNFQSQTIGGRSIWNHCVAFKGENVDFSEWNSMEMDVKSVFGDEAFRTIGRMDELSTIFGSIASRLMGSFMVLNCQVPSAITGPVAWTIPEWETAKTPHKDPPAPRSKPSPWIGISGEIGTFEGDIFAGLNLDIAYSLNDMLAVGGRLGGIMNFATADYCVLLGPEVKITFPEENAIIASAGPAYSVDNGIMFFARAGYKFKNALFLTAETIYNGVLNYGVGVGISFGGK